MWRKPNEIWLTECIVKAGDHSQTSATFDSVGTLAPVDGNIESKKYTEILDTHWLPAVAKHLTEKLFIFLDDNA